jgi:hypothetical protein
MGGLVRTADCGFGHANRVVHAWLQRKAQDAPCSLMGLNLVWTKNGQTIRVWIRANQVVASQEL